ncbi:MAG: LysM domain-containing protein [Anaerolineae bacterium]
MPLSSSIPTRAECIRRGWVSPAQRVSKYAAVFLLLLIPLIACSLTVPEPTPIVVTATPPPPIAITATAVPQLATRAPTDTPFPTDAPCVPRDDWFVYTVSAGDTLSGIALRAGTSVEALSLANCIKPNTALNPEEGVRVPLAILPPDAATNAPGCTDSWFFVFTPGRSEVTVSCPDPVIPMDALGQDFEGGRMLRYPPIPGTSDTQTLIYVLYNNGFWEAYPDTWDSSQPASDETITPPRDRTQPVEAFGSVWRENPTVRAALGWAYAPAASFSGRVQFPTDRTDYWYMEYGTGRLAVRLTRSDVAPNPWETAGTY